MAGPLGLSQRGIMLRCFLAYTPFKPSLLRSHTHTHATPHTVRAAHAPPTRVLMTSRANVHARPIESRCGPPRPCLHPRWSYADPLRTPPALRAPPSPATAWGEGVGRTRRRPSCPRRPRARARRPKRRPCRRSGSRHRRCQWVAHRSSRPRPAGCPDRAAPANAGNQRQAMGMGWKLAAVDGVVA